MLYDDRRLFNDVAVNGRMDYEYEETYTHFPAIKHFSGSFDKPISSSAKFAFNHEFGDAPTSDKTVLLRGGGGIGRGDTRKA